MVIPLYHYLVINKKKDKIFFCIPLINDKRDLNSSYFYTSQINDKQDKIILPVYHSPMTSKDLIVLPVDHKSMTALRVLY